MFNKPFKTAILTASLLLSVSAFAESYASVQEGSTIQFLIGQGGGSMTGVFKKFNGNLVLDAANPAANKITLSVDTGSSSLGGENDKEASAPTWLSSKAFPAATFTSSKVVAKGSRLDVSGKLSIKGISRDVTFAVDLAESGGRKIAKGQVPINRLSFKVGEKEWEDTTMVANEVKVKFNIVLAPVRN